MIGMSVDKGRLHCFVKRGLTIGLLRSDIAYYVYV